MRLTNRIKQAGATGIHFTLASRNSDSDFAPYLSPPRLHIKTLGAGSLYRILTYEQSTIINFTHIKSPIGTAAKKIK